MNEFIRLNIAIIPSKEVSEFAIKVSKEFSEKYPTEFTLDGKKFFPHITIYPVEIATKSLKKFINKIRVVVEKIDKFNVRFGRLWSVRDNGECWVGIPVFKDKKIKLLNKHIVNGIDLSGKARSLAFETYHPHLTITSFALEVVQGSVRLPKMKNETMIVDRIGIFEMGSHGTCKKVLYEFELSG